MKKTLFMVFIFLLLFSCKNNKRGKETTENEINEIVSEQLSTDKILPNIMYVNSPEGLNIRSAPNVYSEKITTVPNKSAVQIKDIDHNLVTIGDIKDNWYLVNYNGTNGWMFGGFLLEKLPYEPPIMIGNWVHVYNTDIGYTFKLDNTYDMFWAPGFTGGTWQLNGDLLTLIETYMVGSDGYGLKSKNIDTEIYNYKISIVDSNIIILDYIKTGDDEYTSWIKEKIILKKIEKKIWECGGDELNKIWEEMEELRELYRQ
jgi:hypothetical protein